MRRFDIATMAPPLKGQPDADKRGLPERAVISAAPKRYRVGGDDEGVMVTAAQVAMLGGQWKPTTDELVRPGSRAHQLKCSLTPIVIRFRPKTGLTIRPSDSSVQDLPACEGLDPSGTLRWLQAVSSLLSACQKELSCFLDSEWAEPPIAAHGRTKLTIISCVRRALAGLRRWDQLCPLEGKTGPNRKQPNQWA